MKTLKNNPSFVALPNVVSRYDWTAFAMFEGNFFMENQEEEVCKCVKGFEGLYEASTLGIVRTTGITKKYGRSIQSRGVVTLKAGIRPNGYSFVVLCKDGVTYKKSVHRIIAETFLDNPENKPCVNHKNGIKTDNRVENLEWATQSENMLHAIRTGLSPNQGERHHKSKLKNEDIFYISNSLSPIKELAEMYGVHLDTIRGIRSGRYWRHLTRPIVVNIVRNGDRSNFSKLKESDVRDIRSSSESVIALAKKYKVGDTCIYAIKNRKTWKQI